MSQEKIESPPASLISPNDQVEIALIYEKLRQAEANLVGPAGRMDILPNNIDSFLLRLLADVKSGHSVTILQSKHALTTAEASKVLGVSRQYFIQLLEKGEIPFHMAGTHRCAYVRDVLVYKAKRNNARRKTLDDLAKQEFVRADYGKVPDDFQGRKMNIPLC